MGTYVINDDGAMVWQDDTEPTETATRNDSEPEEAPKPAKKAAAKEK